MSHAGELAEVAKGPWPNPSSEEWYAFLIRCYFGEGDDPVRLCSDRAYRDMNRTMHGFAAHPSATVIRHEADICIHGALRELSGLPPGTSRFDQWHRDTAESLRRVYRRGKFNSFTFGQAQKWLNMAIKYLYAFGQASAPGFEPHYPFAHVPIDNFLIDATARFVSSRLPCAWSRLDDYDLYLEWQAGFREAFKGSAPLAVEFRLWASESIHRGHRRR